MAFSFDFLDAGTVLEWSLTADRGDSGESGSVVCERITDYTPTLHVGTKGDRDALDAARARLARFPSVVETVLERHRPGFRHEPELMLRVDVDRVTAVDEVALEVEGWGAPGYHPYRCFNVDFSREFRHCLEKGIDPAPAPTMASAQQMTPDEVLALLDDLDLPFLTSKLITREFDCSGQTARNKLAALTEQGALTRVDLGQRQAVWCRPDYEAAGEIADTLREHFDLGAVATEHLGAFAEEPYCILPKQENEAYVVVPRFVPFHAGWLDRQTASHNVFVVNKYVDWIDELPDEIRQQVGTTQKYDHAVVADGQLESTPSQRDEAFEEFTTDRHQDAIPGDDRLAAMDWNRLRGLASRIGVLEQGMSREAVERALAAERDDDRIPLNPSREFDVIAGLIDDGNLPFAPHPVAEADLRAAPSSIDLWDYQERAWERFVETGMIGVYWPPSAGKTFLALYAGERVRGSKLVVVSNNTLKEQWRQRIAAFCDHPDGWEVWAYQYLTQYDNIDEYQNADGPTLTVFDESHYLPANTFAKLATIDTDYRIGLSASPYREDERTEYIFALTGFPVGLKWQELVALGAVETPDAKLFLYDDQAAKRADVPRILAERPGKTLVLCDSLDRGRELAENLDAPFVSGETRDRMAIFQDPENRVVIGSRVADEGLSLIDLDVVIEHDFHGGSRRQEAQRYGRVMHGASTGEHIIQMTDAGYEKYSNRLLSLKEQGITVDPERRDSTDG